MEQHIEARHLGGATAESAFVVSHHNEYGKYLT
jgi:hypothetical protein